MFWSIIRSYNLFHTNVTKAMCVCVYVHSHVCLHVLELTCVSVGVHCAHVHGLK